MKRPAHYILVMLLFLTACSSLPSIPSTPTALSPIEQETAVPTIAPQAPIEEIPQVLHIWLPPQFDPNAETPAAALLKARLDEFEKRRPNLTLDIRIKAIEGQASLLNALQSAKNAAPETLPDLIALPPYDLEAAVLSGLLHPFDGLSTLIDDPDWFSYARELAHIQNAAYGLPFAGNALSLLYRPDTENLFVPSWKSFTEQESQLVFPADNAHANLSFCLYLEIGNPLLNEEGLPTLDESALTELLTFYQSELISPTSTQLQTDEQVWDIYSLQTNATAIIWTNDYLINLPADAAIVPVPGLMDESCSIATAWLWALGGSNADMEPVAVELAEFLSDSTFLAAWTAAAGVLPPRPTALDAWDEDSAKFALREISQLAQAIPASDVQQVLGEIFRDATMLVSQEQVDPSEIAQSALENLK